MTTERLHQQQMVTSAGEGVNVQSCKNKTKKFTVTISPGSAHLLLRGGAQFYQVSRLLEPKVLKREDGCKTIQLTRLETEPHHLTELHSESIISFCFHLQTA